ncbi:MAG: tRNA pseudouridine(55) synthase TruB [Devosia sp.]
MTKPKRIKRPISGWLIFDKPYDLASTEAVGKLRWLYSAAKAGHAGTLDPLATGILPIAFGQATKTVPMVQDGTKTYHFTVRWGTATTTDDIEGEVIATSPVRPEASAITALLPRFTGTILQTPPPFSAIRVGGQRAYDLARAGETVVLAPREITIDSLRLIAHSGEESRFEAICQKGTYVRALARDIAETLGTRGHVTALRRTAVGPFHEADATGLEAIEALDEAGRDALLRPIAEALGELPEIRLSPEQMTAIGHGNPVLLTGARAPVNLGEAWASFRGDACALGRVEAGHFHPSRLLTGS